MSGREGVEISGNVRSLKELTKITQAPYVCAPFIRPPYNWIAQQFDHSGCGVEIAALSNVKVTDVYNIYHAESKTFVTEVSYPESLKTFRIHHEYNKDGSHLTICRPKEKITKKIHETCLLIGGHSNHYHWILNWLPRLGIWLKYGSQLDVSPQKFCVHHGISEAHLESLALLGINSSQLIILRPDVYDYEFSSLIVPSFFSSHCYYQEVVDFLRSIETSSCAEKTRGVYISRNEIDVPRRRVLNEIEILPILNQYNLKSVALERLSLSEQVAAFRSADVIVGAHGAGLANIAFSRPGSKCIFFEGKRVSEFVELARFCGLECNVVTPTVHIDEAAEDNVPNFHPRNRDIIVDAEELRLLLVAIPTALR